VMSEAVRAVVEYAFRTFDLEHVFAGLFAHNVASARVLEKAGFTLEGRLRRHMTKYGVTLDDLIYGITLAEVIPS
jgi:RimJ/RimL family protein N-acetyltransferase